MKSLVNLSLLFFILVIPHCQDSAIRDEIAIQLAQSPTTLGLTYANSVKRFYKENGFSAIWIQAASKPSQTWESMLVLDCVKQYGLSHADYHSDELLYPRLRVILNDPSKVTAKERARIEIVLTDALITLINDLHFGKANPVYTRQKIDEGNLGDFDAGQILTNAIGKKDFLSHLLAVQPKSSAYHQLQKYMVRIRGQELDGCYSTPEGEARKVAINMERLKWVDLSAPAYIQVNIPSYTLRLHLPDTVADFKVIVGKPSSPTPILTSTIGFIITGPDWKVPHELFVTEILPRALADIDFLVNNRYTIYDQKGKYLNVDAVLLEKIKNRPKAYMVRQSSRCEPSLGRVAFHFPNTNGNYLFEVQQNELFNFSERAFTNSFVGVQYAEKLASFLLQFDHQQSRIAEMKWNIDSYTQRNFVLQKSIPIVIGYQTCIVKDNKLMVFNDIYKKDAELEKKLYSSEVMLAKK
jgi:murein L,D-transpeptidase YcbB/YkuD